MTNLRPWAWSVLLLVVTNVIGTDATSTTCLMCGAQGNGTLGYPDRVIPFFNLPGGNASPTCREVARAAATAATDVNCKVIQAQASYCGCQGSEWSATHPDLNVCSLCPDGSKPSLTDFVTPSGDACVELDWYSRHLSAAECDTPRVQSIQALAHLCGCARSSSTGSTVDGTTTSISTGVAKPSCSWCPSDPTLLPPHPNRKALKNGETCGQLFDFFAEYYTPETCVDDASTIQLVAARCECPGIDTPVCPIQQNPHLCTREMMSRIPSKYSGNTLLACECAAFCGDQFLTCYDHPGLIISEYDCPEGATLISGCNLAMVRLLEGTHVEEEDSSFSTSCRWAAVTTTITILLAILTSTICI